MDLIKPCIPCIAGIARAALATAPLLAPPLSQALTLDADAPSYTVSYTLDSLSTPTGQDALRRHIVLAARRVCRDAWNRDEMPLVSQYSACVREATTRALADVQKRTGIREVDASSR